MAKNGNGEGGKWGNLRPGRRSAHLFDRLVSPLGEDCVENPVYSPSRTVEGAKGQPRGQVGTADRVEGKASGNYSAREQRRS